jgi:hypothetical protein
MLTVVTVGLALTTSVQARGPFSRAADQNALRHARVSSWHGNYYHTAHGYPVPLVVPPTANMQTSWSWGVAQSTMKPIYHQFRRPFPGDMSNGGEAFRPTPGWPSHSDQFGVYYIRGPW